MNETPRESIISLRDSEIWDLFKGGSETAFDYIYQTYFDRLYNYGCQFTPDHLLVEDAIQEMFIDLRRRASHLSSTDRILPYLYSSFRRKVIRMREKSRKNQEFEPKKYTPFNVSIEDSIIEQEFSEEAKRKLESAMGQVSEKYREIIYQYYYENLSYEEIQQVLGFDQVKSVRNLLYKALKALRKHIDDSVWVLLVHFAFDIYTGIE